MKKGKEYLKFMGIQGFNLYWPNNNYKNISPPDFGADSYGMGSLTKLKEML